MGICKACGRTTYQAKSDGLPACSGCFTDPEKCACVPLPIITVRYDSFVDYAWMEDDDRPINGLPQLPFCVGSICGEAGEAWEKVKKMYRDDGGTLTDERRAALLKELGDALFYVTKAAHLIGYTLGQVAESNVEKLTQRIAERTLHGDGDER